LVRHKQWKRDMRFGNWRVRSLYRSVSLTAVARDLSNINWKLWVCCRLGGTKGVR